MHARPTPGDPQFEVPFAVSDATAVPLTRELEQRRKLARPPIQIVAVPGARPISVGDAGLSGASVEGTSDSPASVGLLRDILTFMWQGILWGAISLVTPCVFPMIPITVSYFIKQSEKQHHQPGGSSGSEAPFQIGSCSIDPRKFLLRRGKLTEELTAKELKLLQLFHAHPGEVFSRDRLLNDVWGYNYYGTTRTLDQVVVQLRKKLGDSADDPKHLITVHGVGYKLVL